mgnify:FL=1
MDNLFEILINKSLEPYNVNIEYVRGNPEIDGLPWCQFYTMSKDEYEAFSKWAVEKILKIRKCGKERARAIYGMYDLAFGLKVIE